MDANQYQKDALRTEKTPLFANDDRVLSRLLHGSIGLATEVGELQDAIKKHLIYGKSLDNVNIIEECGDALWYIALTLDAVNATMSDAMERNIAKLQKRYGEAFTQEKALNRDLEAERKVLESPSPRFEIYDRATTTAVYMSSDAAHAQEVFAVMEAESPGRYTLTTTQQ